MKSSLVPFSLGVLKDMTPKYNNKKHKMFCG